jgi:hypothetical protein
MRGLTFCFLVLLLNCESSKSTSLKVKLVEVMYVDVSILTPIHIKCEEFEKQFGNAIKSAVITNERDLEELFYETERIEKAGRSTEIPADARIKAKIIFENDSVKELCIGRTVLSSGKSNVILDERFQKFIKSKFE